MIRPRIARLDNLDDIGWWQAPIPPRNHTCWAQTTAYDVLGLKIVERCACGAIRLDADNPYVRDGMTKWAERNQRSHDDEPTAQPRKKWWHRK